METRFVIGECQPRYRVGQFLKFLRKIDCTLREGLDVHLIVDNDGPYNTPMAHAGLEKYSQFFSSLCYDFSSTARSDIESKSLIL